MLKIADPTPTKIPRYEERNFNKTDVLSEMYEFLTEVCDNPQDPENIELAAELGAEPGAWHPWVAPGPAPAPATAAEVWAAAAERWDTTVWQSCRPGRLRRQPPEVAVAAVVEMWRGRHDPELPLFIASARERWTRREWDTQILPRMKLLGLGVPVGRPRALDLRTAAGPGYWEAAEGACQEVLAADRRSLGRAADAEAGMAPAPTEAEIARRWADANRRALARAEGRGRRRAGRSRAARPADLDRAAERIFAILRG